MGRQVNADRFVSFSSLLSILVGLMGLAGCFFHVQMLRTLLPGMVAITANTSVCLILLGVSLWLLHEREGAAATGTTKWVAKAAAAVSGVVGLLSLLEFFGKLNLGIDQLLFSETAGAALGHVRPGLMSPVSAIVGCRSGLT